MGYKVHSFLSVGSADGHEYFLYYLPAQGMASLWLNQWINANFDRLASKLGPKAVLITAPDGREDNFVESGREVMDLLRQSLEDGTWEASRWEVDRLLHEGGPILLVSRRPLHPEHVKEAVDCAAINLGGYDPQRLAVLFDHVIRAIQEERDPVEGIPLPDVQGSHTPGYMDALELKPNIFGLGINGNAVIELLRRWRERRRERPQR